MEFFYLLYMLSSSFSHLHNISLLLPVHFFVDWHEWVYGGFDMDIMLPQREFCYVEPQ